jgi:hypothetical protein
MVLPKGAYATTVLGSVFVLEDGSEAAKVASGRGTVADSPPNEEMLDDTGPSSR